MNDPHGAVPRDATRAATEAPLFQRDPVTPAGDLEEGALTHKSESSAPAHSLADPLPTPRRPAHSRTLGGRSSPHVSAGDHTPTHADRSVDEDTHPATQPRPHIEPPSFATRLTTPPRSLEELEADLALASAGLPTDTVAPAHNDFPALPVPDDDTVAAFPPTSERHARRRPSSAAPQQGRGRLTLRRGTVVVLGTAMLTVTALAAYLCASASAWRDRANTYLDTSLTLGNDLASEQNDLAGAQAELAAVRAQLDASQTRMLELANEKAQLGDAWEIQQQLVDYQERVTDAAGQVASALDQCVQGQQELIGYLETAGQPGGPAYDPAELTRFETEVETLCQAATEANITLQLELSR